MERQKQSLLDYAKGYEVVAISEDMASGLNENRKSLNKIFDMVEEEIGVIITASKDRLDSASNTWSVISLLMA